VEPKWLEWARKVQALAQNGLTYTESQYDRERYHELRDVALEMLAAGAEADMRAVHDLFRETGYATPKVDVRGAVFRDGEVLLVREKADGGWTLPGGWADVWDRPSEAVEREVREESGYVAKARKLAACWDRALHGHTHSVMRIYKLFFICELVGGEAAESSETTGVGFFREGEWPPLSVARTTPWELTRLFEHLRHPDLPTDFD
jgi:ADP-ribose pyrophosphatase YjhB (NUDIX family)